MWEELTVCRKDEVCYEFSFLSYVLFFNCQPPNTERSGSQQSSPMVTPLELHVSLRIRALERWVGLQLAHSRREKISKAPHLSPCAWTSAWVQAYSSYFWECQLLPCNRKPIQPQHLDQRMASRENINDPPAEARSWHELGCICRWLTLMTSLWLCHCAASHAPQLLGGQLSETM